MSRRVPLRNRASANFETPRVMSSLAHRLHLPPDELGQGHQHTCVPGKCSLNNQVIIGFPRLSSSAPMPRFNSSSHMWEMSMVGSKKQTKAQSMATVETYLLGRSAFVVVVIIIIMIVNHHHHHHQTELDDRGRRLQMRPGETLHYPTQAYWVVLMMMMMVMMPLTMIMVLMMMTMTPSELVISTLDGWTCQTTKKSTIT